MKHSSIIRERSFEFALEVIHFYRTIIKNREYILSKQILRSGTGIGANVEEALGGQSRRDFIAKMSIANKEARETIYWLRLYQQSEFTPYNIKELLDEAQQIQKMLASIIITTRQNS